MNLNDYQAAVLRTAADDYTDSEAQKLLWAIALTGEAGEVARALLERGVADANSTMRILVFAAELGAAVGTFMDRLKKHVGHGHALSEDEVHDLLLAIMQATTNMNRAFAGKLVQRTVEPASLSVGGDEGIAGELGDVLWYLAALAFLEDCSLEYVARGNLGKLNSRYPNGFDAERSKNRRA